MSGIFFLLSALCVCTFFCNAFHPPTNFVEHHHGAKRHRYRCKPFAARRHGPIRLQYSPMQSSGPEKRGARVAFLGNSIIYYNDCPRFLMNLGKGSVKYQDSCLRPSTNLTELWEQGNGMNQPYGFATEAAKNPDIDEDLYLFGPPTEPMNMYDVGAPTVNALLECSDENKGKEKWDFVVMNDHTQAPARLDSRKTTQTFLLEKYLPLILENQATLVIIETAAYQRPGINNSKDLGSAHEFQRRVREGIQSYLEALHPKFPETLQPRIAPVGTAYLHIHDNNNPLWNELFDPFDHFHPSPLGTFLQGCVVHCTLFGCAPPLPRTEEEIKALWRDARVMHHIKTGKNRRLPSVKEAEELWNVAKRVCTRESSL